ncbi:MAG: hypothetical protein WCC66_06735 [Rhizobiaceae bacterium]
MTLARKVEAKARMSIYVTAENRKRLASVPKGLKTALINDALSQVLTAIEKRENFESFLESVRSIQPVKVSKSSEEMVRALREPGSADSNS